MVCGSFLLAYHKILFTIKFFFANINPEHENGARRSENLRNKDFIIVSSDLYGRKVAE